MSSELQEVYNGFKAKLETIDEKIMELEEDSEQHRKVLGLLADMDSERKSMQMIGSVLVEKKVKDVIPSLEETLQGLQKAIATLNEDRRMWQTRMDKWKTENKIKVVNA